MHLHGIYTPFCVVMYRFVGTIVPLMHRSRIIPIINT